jgi:hypothetical protein
MGVEVMDLDSQECSDLLAGFIGEHPEIWNVSAKNKSGCSKPHDPRSTINIIFCLKRMWMLLQAQVLEL